MGVNNDVVWGKGSVLVTGVSIKRGRRDKLSGSMEIVQRDRALVVPARGPGINSPESMCGVAIPPYCCWCECRDRRISGAWSPPMQLLV